MLDCPPGNLVTVAASGMLQGPWKESMAISMPRLILLFKVKDVKRIVADKPWTSAKKQ